MIWDTSGCIGLYQIGMLFTSAFFLDDTFFLRLTHERTSKEASGGITSPLANKSDRSAWRPPSIPVVVVTSEEPVTTSRSPCVDERTARRWDGEAR